MIWTADWHLRLTPPRCRTETEKEWFEKQKATLEFIYSFGEPVAVFGDIFHHYKPGDAIMELFLSFALHGENKTYIMAGNHDMRNGHIDPDSGYGILQHIVESGHPNLKAMEDIYDCIYYGEEEIRKGAVEGVLGLHRLTFSSSSAVPPNSGACTARSLLDLFPGYKYIVVGDNHHSFIYEKEGRFVISPGCITKQAVDFKDLTLSIVRHQKETKQIELVDDAELVNDAYIVAEHDREKRYDDLVASLQADGELSFDYKSNVYARMEENKLNEGTVKIIEEVLPYGT